MKVTEDIQIEFFNRIGRRIREFDEKHGWIDYFIAPVIVTVILLAVYAIKGVYPFGVNTIAYYDMPTNGMAGYSWLYDVLHGKTGLYLDWNTGLGNSMAAGGGEFFPINWFFLFVNRDGILYAISFYLMIKVELIAFSMSFYMKKRYGDTLITVCAGVLYAFSGYVLQYYTNIDFIDFALMLPLIVYALERMLNEHKYVLYTILMFFMFMCSIQLMFMLCLYIVFKSYFILKSVPEEIKGKSIRLFAISTLAAALLAGFVLIPMLVTLVGSVRVTKGANGKGGGFDYFEKMKLVYNYYRRQKEFMMYGSEIAMAILLLIVLRGKNVLRKYLYNIVMIIILTLPILHEGINLLWHAGSYKHFPLRFGYMITFECLILVGEYYKNEEFRPIKYLGRGAKLIGTALIPFVAYVLFKFFSEFTKAGIGELGPYHTYWLYFITLSGIFFIAFLIDSQKTRIWILFSVVIIQGFCGCYGLIAPETARIGQYRIQYVLRSIALKNEFNGSINRTNRIKMDPAYYDPNDSFIIGQPTVSYWSYGVNSKTEEELQKNMGYDGMSTCVLDSGGTVLTDALLGVKYMATYGSADEKLYTRDENKKNVYKCNYTLPFGIVFEKDKIDDESEDFKYHNELFNNIVGNGELISIIEADDLIESVKTMSEIDIKNMNDLYVENGPEGAYIIISNDGENALNDNGDKSIEDLTLSEDNNVNEKDDEQLFEYKLLVNANDDSIIYLNVDESFANEIMIMKNGCPLYMSSFDSYGYYTFPNNIVNGIYLIGSMEKDDLMKLSIHTTNENLEGVRIGILDCKTLQDGIERLYKNQNLKIESTKNSMHITGAANISGTLFLPIGYSDNWHAKMNGKSISVRPYINDAFVGIDVEKGDIDIELSYMPKGLITGIILSVIGLLICCVLTYFEKNGGFNGKKCEPVLDKVFIYGYTAVVVVMFIAIYIIPVYIKMAL